MSGGVESGKVMDELVKPRLRGVSHQWAFFVALVAGIVLVIAAPAGRATLAATIYAISVAAMFGASALYHRIDWKSLAARRWMRRLDHSMIYLLIAGTYTPFALLVLDGGLAHRGADRRLGRRRAGHRPEAAVARHAQVADRGGLRDARLGGGDRVPAARVRARASSAMALVAGGGILYTAGAVVYALRRPDPAPAVFGYHEIFHVLVIAAAVLQFVAVAAYALPAG